MRVLFYGSLNPTDPDYQQTCSFVSKLVEDLLDCGAVIATREGNSANFMTIEGEKRFKDATDIIPIDNVVLDAACKYREKESMPYDRVISFAETKQFDQGNYSEHSRNIIILPVPHRLTMYLEMLERTDVLVTVGGKEGVYRIGLFAYALHKPVIPLGFTGGTSRVLWKEMAASGKIPIDATVVEQLGATQFPRSAEIKQLAGAICKTAQQSNDNKHIVQSTTKDDSKWQRVKSSLSMGDMIGLASVILTVVITIIGATWSLAIQFEQSRSVRNTPTAEVRSTPTTSILTK